MVRQPQAEVEARYQAPLKIVLENLASEGLNKKTAAERLGITKVTLLRWIARHDVAWPIYTKEHARNRKNRLRERCLYRVLHNGEEKPLFDAAKAEKIPYNVILERYKKGDRDKRLFRKVRSYRGVYDVEISVKDWTVACELAEAIGAKRASQKLGIPMGALTKVMNGEIEL